MSHYTDGRHYNKELFAWELDSPDSASLHTDIKKYLDQLAPHVKNREAARLLQRVITGGEIMNADEKQYCVNFISEQERSRMKAANDRNLSRKHSFSPWVPILMPITQIDSNSIEVEDWELIKTKRMCTACAYTEYRDT